MSTGTMPMRPSTQGPNTLISRRALTEVGGIATDSITEDFATGIRIQAAGYRCYAIPTVLAHGLAPATLRDLISQRRRWGRGCVQTLRQSHWLRHMGLPLRTRLSYYSSFLYWWAFFPAICIYFSPNPFYPVPDCYRGLHCARAADFFQYQPICSTACHCNFFPAACAAQGGATLSTPPCFRI